MPALQVTINALDPAVRVECLLRQHQDGLGRFLGYLQRFTIEDLFGDEQGALKPSWDSCDAVLIVKRQTRAVAGQGLSIAEYQRLNRPSSLVRSERRETDMTKIDAAICRRDLRCWSLSLP